jgi:diacylglycerol kinase family enzyme
VTAVLIVNPRASKVSDDLVERVLAALPAGVEVVPTSAAGEATALAREREASADAIYVLGGDGTYNEVLNGVTTDVPLGFLPGGGTSVLPRALGLGREPVAAARLTTGGGPRAIGLGRVNGRRFSFNAGIGFDAELVRRIDARGRAADGRRPGDAAFVREAIGLITAHRGRLAESLEIEDAGRAAFVLVANCDPYTYAGPMGLHAAPEARFELGIDIVAPRRLTPRAVPRFARYLLRGKGQQEDEDVLYAHDLDRLEIRCDRPLPLQADGEDLGDADQVLVEAERDALTVLA